MPPDPTGIAGAMSHGGGADPKSLLTLHEADTWHEDHGDVLWHHIGEYGDICEAPIVSRGDDDLDEKQPWDGYYSHWSRLPQLPQFPLRSLMIAPPGTLICDWEGLSDG